MIIVELPKKELKGKETEKETNIKLKKEKETSRLRMVKKLIAWYYLGYYVQTINCVHYFGLWLSSFAQALVYDPAEF